MSARRYELDGQPVTLDDLLEVNGDSFTACEIDAIFAMQPGDAMLLGGGAFAEFVLACEADEVTP